MFDLDKFYETFHKPYDESTEIDNTFAKICNEQGLKAGIDYLLSIGATKLDRENYEITYKINECTKETTTPEQKQELIESLLRLDKYVKNASITYNAKKKKEEIIIGTTEGEIRVIEFSSISPKIKEKIPSITTSERAGKCFDLAYTINRGLGLPHTVVTGFIYGYTDKSKFLHSWIELTYKGEEYVIDGTLNAMINKEGYYLLKHAQPITKIPDDVLQSDLENHLEKLQGLPFELYLVYRDEIINGLEITQDKVDIKPNF